MANTLRFKRGLVSGIPTAALGEPLFTTDTFDLYIGNGTGNTRFQKYIASGATTQILRGDGSLYTFPLAISSPSTGQVLKYNGTSWVNDSDAGITGSGSAGQVAYFTGATTQSGSNNLFWDNTNARLGIGTNVPSGALDVRGGANSQIRTTDGTIVAKVQAVTSLAAYIGTETNHETRIITNNSPRITIFGGGNVHVGGTSDNGLRFQVTGDGYFSGSVGIGTSSLTGYTMRVQKVMTGSTVVWGMQNSGIIQSDVTNTAFYYSSQAATQATAFSVTNLVHYFANQSTIGAGSSVTNQYGFSVENTLTGATNNFGFYGNIASGTGRWNLYMNGTANNYMAGDFYVGQPVLRTSDASIRKFILNGSQDGIGAEIVLCNETANDGASNAISFTGIRGAYGISGQIRTTRRGIMTFHTQDLQSLVSPPERMRLDASGNLGLGVVPSAWSSGQAAIQGSGWAITQTGVNNTYYIQNANFNGTNWIYRNSFAASFYLQSAGSHQWYQAPSGTAGNTISWTIPMTLFATGNLAVGTTSDAGYRLDVNGTMRVSGDASIITGGNAILNIDGLSTSTSGIIIKGSGTERGRISFSNSNNMRFFIGSGVTQYLEIDATTRAATFSSSVTAASLVVDTNTLVVDATNDRVGIGTTTPNYKTHIVSTSIGAESVGLRIQNADTTANTSAAIDFAMSTDLANLGSTAKISAIRLSLNNTALRFITSNAGTLNEGMRLTNLQNFLIGTTTDAGYKLRVNGTSYFDDSLRFPNLKGVVFVQTGGSLLGSISMDSSNQVTIDNNGFFGLSVGSNYTMTGGNLGIGHAQFGTSATRTVSVVNGTAPSTSPTDAFQMYSNDVVAGNAAPHFRTENGAVIKLYQETTAVGNSTISVGGGNAVLDDTEFDGYTLRQIVRALRNQGILQ